MTMDQTTNQTVAENCVAAAVDMFLRVTFNNSVGLYIDLYPRCKIKFMEN